MAVAPSKAEEKPKPAQSIDELRQQIEKILKDTHTPGASVAIVHRDGPEWVAGIGLADVASSRPATADTLFRIGSVSKSFVALSVLMLADQGKLSLNDPVRTLAPDVWFRNRWEATDPVRVVHLLEHTTGWEDVHMHEFAMNVPGTVGLGEALTYDHRARICRWRPGTRWAYSSYGPAVAAHIVERITGQRFEDFVEQNLFRPIGMKTVTYFEPLSGTGTTLYHDDGKTPYPYWNLLVRPSGSINASAEDMAFYIQFLLNRGAVNGKQILPESDIDRGESPTSTWAAKQGRKVGYGMISFWNSRDGFIWHGHAGTVPGGQTWIEYMPDYGLGYYFSTNSSNGDAFDQIDEAIRRYLTRNLEKPALPPLASVGGDAAAYDGWYEPDSPQYETTHFLERLAGTSLIRFKDRKLLLSGLGGTETFVPVTLTQFRWVPRDKALSPDPLPMLTLLTPNSEGRFIDLGATFRRIPAWFAIIEILAIVYVIACVISVLVYAPFWMLAGLSRKRRRPAERLMRVWPVVAVLTLLLAVGIFNASAADPLTRQANPTVWSVSLFVATLIYPTAIILSAISCWRAHRGLARKSVRRFSLAVTLGLLISAAYFGYWGLIGFRTWA